MLGMTLSQYGTFFAVSHVVIPRHVDLKKSAEPKKNVVFNV